MSHSACVQLQLRCQIYTSKHKYRESTCPGRTSSIASWAQRPDTSARASAFKTTPKEKKPLLLQHFLLPISQQEKNKQETPFPCLLFSQLSAVRLTYLQTVYGTSLGPCSIEELSLVVVPRGSSAWWLTLPLIHGSWKEKPNKRCLPKDPTGQCLKDKLAT